MLFSTCMGFYIKAVGSDNSIFNSQTDSEHTFYVWLNDWIQLLFFWTGIFKSTDRCCREHDHCLHTIPAYMTNYGVFNSKLFTLSHCDCDQRWAQECGESLALNQDTKYTAPPVKHPPPISKWSGLSYSQNWSCLFWLPWTPWPFLFPTRFHHCLHAVNNSISNTVGYSFFNILRVPCFELKQQRQCTETYSWGM